MNTILEPLSALIRYHHYEITAYSCICSHSIFYEYVLTKLLFNSFKKLSEKETLEEYTNRISIVRVRFQLLIDVRISIHNRKNQSFTSVSRLSDFFPTLFEFFEVTYLELFDFRLEVHKLTFATQVHTNLPYIERIRAVRYLRIHKASTRAIRRILIVLMSPYIAPIRTRKYVDN